MVAFAILCALTGGTLGLRFTVAVLVPATAAVLAMIMGTIFVAGTDPWSAAIAALVSTTLLQLGYFSGAAIRLFLAAARSPAAQRPAAPSVARPVLRIVRPHSD